MFGKPFRKPWENDGGHDRPARPAGERRGGFKKSWDRDGGDRPARGFKKPWERDDHDSGEFRPARSHDDFHGSFRGDRKPFGEKRGGFKKTWERDGEDRPARGFKKPWDRDGEERPARGFKKPWERDGEDRPARGFKKPWDRDGEDRPARGFKKPWDRDGEDRPAKSFKKPWDNDAEGAERPARSFRKPRAAAIPAEGELVYGRQPVREILRAGRRPVNLLVLADSVKDSEEIADIKQLCEEKGVKVEFYKNEDCEAWVNGANHQGVVAFCAEYPYAELDEIVADLAAKEGNATVVVLDHIVDPQNLGSLLRTCECAGVVGVVIPTDKAVGVTPAAVRASAGAAEHLKIARISNLVTALERFKGVEGTWITGLEALPEAKPYTEIDFKGKVCLVVGSEAHGICSPVRGKCDFLAKLPMFGRVNSLNAGVAGGLALYEILRQQA